MRLLIGLGVGFILPAVARAQQEAVVEQVALVLAAEDARDWQQGLFQRSLQAPDTTVRRVAALAAGRIADRAEMTEMTEKAGKTGRTERTGNMISGEDRRYGENEKRVR